MNDRVFGIRFTADSSGLVGEILISKVELDKLAEATGKSASKAKELNDEQKSLGSTLSGLASRIGAYTIGWNVAADAVMRAASAVKDYIKDSMMLNARFEELGVAMKIVGANTGYSGQQMENLSRSLQTTGISMIESRESLLRMASAQIDLSKATELADVARNAAIVGMKNTSEAFQQLIYGIQSGQTDILKTIGINVNFEAGYRTLAKQLGVTTEQLTEHEKMQSRTNTVIVDAAAKAGLYEAAMGTAAKQIRTLARYEEDLKVLRGQVFNEALVIAVNAYTDSLKTANTETKRLAEENKLKEWGRDLVTTFAWVGDVLLGAWDVFAQVVESSAVVLLQSMNALRNAVLNMFPGMKQLLGAATGANIDAYVEAFVGRADENLAKRLNRKQFRTSAEEFYAQQDADAAAKALAPERLGSVAPGERPAGAGGKADPWAALNVSAAEHTALLRAELDSTEKISEAEKIYLKVVQDVIHGKIDYNEKAFEEFSARLSQMDALEKEITLRKAIEEANKKALAYVSQQIALQEKQDETLAQFNTSLSEHLQQIQFETELYGKTEIQKETAIELRKLNNEYLKASIGLEGEEFETLTKLYELQKAALPDALSRRGAAKEAADQLKKNADEAKRLNDELGRGLSDALMRGFEAGKGFGKNFFDSLKNMARTTILRPVIEFMLSPYTSAVTEGLSALKIPGVGGAASSGGGGGGLFGGLFGDLFGGLFGGGSMGDPMPLLVGAFDTGTDYVPRTGFALVHEGEAIIPADQNRDAGGTTVHAPLNISIDARGAAPGVENSILRTIQAQMPGLLKQQERVIRGIVHAGYSKRAKMSGLA